MKKSTKHSFEPVYNYNDIIKYIEDKYQIDTRDYLGKFKTKKGKFTCNDDVQYLDFWHWFLEHNDIHNGCFAYFPEDWDADSPWWVREIMQLIVKEFFPNGEDMKVWVSW